LLFRPPSLPSQLVRGASAGTEDIYKIYAKSFQGADHLRRILEEAKDIEGLDSLAELALDMRWSWNHCADEVWRKLDPALWDPAGRRTNPVAAMIQSEHEDA